MKSSATAVLASAVLLSSATVLAGAAQDAKAPPPTGTIEFTARVQPTGGRPEPARLLAFSLLRKSFADIQAEAEKGAARPDLEKFIEGLNVSAELKGWMKRTRIVHLSGSEFMRAVKVDDILTVPEFFESYISRNAGDTTVGFPASRAKDTDRTKNPQKYEQDQKQYREAIRNFIAKNPHTRDGLEVPLVDINPGQRWQQQEMERKKRVRLVALELAETQYFVARAETDMEGRATFAKVPEGDYWLSSLEGEGVAGDARLRWDFPVPVRAGRITRVTLSNVNAVRNP
jgi:hypothetical protein